MPALSEDLLELFENDEFCIMEGYDDCLIGVVERLGQPPIACYDKAKVLARLKSEGMTNDEAKEFFYYNQLGAWMGDSTPCFFTPWKHSKIKTTFKNEQNKTSR